MTFTRPLGPFSILYQPRSIPDSKQAPKKRGPRPKTEQSAISLETPEERKARQAKEKAHKTAQVLKPGKYSDIGRNFPSQADRTNKITGRRIGARSQ